MQARSELTLLDRLRLRLWSWRLRELRCTQCDSAVDRIELRHDKGYVHRIVAHCSVCDHWDDWRR